MLPAFLLCPKLEFFKKLIYKQLKLNNYENIEIEVRLGQIMHTITKKRIEYSTEHPIVFSRLPYEFYFENGVNDADFKKIKKSITEDKELPLVKDTITICDRVRKIESAEGSRYEEKIRIKSIDIFLPEYKYDIRISVSKEKTIDPKKVSLGTKERFKRIRERESYVIGPFSFDFTKVSRELEKKDLKTFEVELELKDPDTGLDDFIDILFNFPVISK